jgi:hypothetical protein
VPAQASPVLIGAAPNPASVGQRVVHTVGLGAPGRLDPWVSAVGSTLVRLIEPKT